MRDGEFVIALVRETETAENNYDFDTVYPIMKKFAGDRKYFDSSVRSANGRLLIEFDEQIKRYKEPQFPIV